MSRLLSLALVTLSFVGCGAESVDDAIASLQASYDGGEYETVVANAPALAERAESEGASTSTVWKIHKLHLRSLAEDGRGDDVAAAAKAMPAAFSDKLDPSLFQMLAQAVADADEKVQAVAVIEQALERHPDKKDVFNGMVEELSKDPGAADALAQLGYL